MEMELTFCLVFCKDGVNEVKRSKNNWLSLELEVLVWPCEVARLDVGPQATRVPADPRGALSYRCQRQQSCIHKEVNKNLTRTPQFPQKKSPCPAACRAALSFASPPLSTKLLHADRSIIPILRFVLSSFGRVPNIGGCCGRAFGGGPNAASLARRRISFVNGSGETAYGEQIAMVLADPSGMSSSEAIDAVENESARERERSSGGGRRFLAPVDVVSDSPPLPASSPVLAVDSRDWC